MPEVSRLSNEKQAPETKPEFLDHLRSLHLSTIEGYQTWCERHGFSRRIQKTWRERLKERSYFVRAVADSRLAQKKLETRNPDKVIEAILRGDLTEGDVTQPHLVEVCRAHQRTTDCERTRNGLLGLLRHVRRHADLFSVEPVIPHSVRDALVSKGLFEVPHSWLSQRVPGIQLELSEDDEVTVSKCLFEDY